MSNGNLDNSAPSVGVLKLQITRPKHRGLEPKWTSPRWVIIAISRSTSHPRKLVTEKRAAPTAGPLGSTRPSPSDTCCGLNYQNVFTFQDRWHVPWSKTPEERKEHGRQGNGSSQKAWWQSCTNESLHVTGSDIPRISVPTRAWNDEITAWVVERSTNWELLIFQVCQTSVNNHQDHWYLHLPLLITCLIQLSLTVGPWVIIVFLLVSCYRWEVRHHQAHITFFLTRCISSGSTWQQPARMSGGHRVLIIEKDLKMCT